MKQMVKKNIFNIMHFNLSKTQHTHTHKKKQQTTIIKRHKNKGILRDSNILIKTDSKDIVR